MTSDTVENGSQVLQPGDPGTLNAAANVSDLTLMDSVSKNMFYSGTVLFESYNDLFHRHEKLYDEVKSFLPDPESYRHPDKARPVLRSNMDWSERSLNRATMDFMDSKRDHLLSILKMSDMDGLEVTVPAVDRRTNRQVDKKIPLRDVILRVFRDLRSSTLRHQNTYFRAQHYFVETLITGGEIPSFPYKDPFRDDKEDKEDIDGMGS